MSVVIQRTSAKVRCTRCPERKPHSAQDATCLHLGEQILDIISNRPDFARALTKRQLRDAFGDQRSVQSALHRQSSTVASVWLILKLL